MRMTQNHDAVMDELKRRHDFRNARHDVIITSLYGSQNYDLDDANSDIDARVLVCPFIQDLVWDASHLSLTRNEPDGSHTEVKDFRGFFHELLKQNINSLETLFTDCYIANEQYADEWETLRGLGERVASYDPVRMAQSMRGATNGLFFKMERHKWERPEENAKATANIMRTANFVNVRFEHKRDFGEAIRAFPLYSADDIVSMKRSTDIPDRKLVLDMVNYINDTCYKVINGRTIMTSDKQVKGSMTVIATSILEKHLRRTW